MNKFANTINPICLFILLISTLITYCFGYISLIGELSSVICVVAGLLLVIKAYSARNSLFFTIFVFLLLYTWPSKLLFINHIYLSGHHLEYTFLTAFWTTSILTFFLLLLYRFIKIPKGSSTIVDFYKSNNLVFGSLLFVSVIITVLFRPVGNVYMGDEDTSNSSLYEYNLIFLFALYKYSDNKRKKILFWLVCILYTFFTITSGGRVTIIMLCLLLLVIRFQNTIDFRKISVVVIIGIWLMNVFENIRSNPSILIEANILDILNPIHSIESDYQFSNFADVFWASERLIILSETGELSWSQRLLSFFYFIISPILSSSSFPDLANLTTYKRDIYSSGGGSLAPVIFYMYLGIVGVYFLAKFIARNFNKLSVINSSFASTYSIFLVISLPRWFAYYPIQLIKFCVIAAIIIYVINKFDNKIGFVSPER